MSAPTDRIAEQVARATQRLGQLRARQLLREMRAASQAKARARRSELRRRIQLGGAVITAGCGDWDLHEVVGVLLDGKERMGASPTMRLAMRKRGEAARLGIAAGSEPHPTIQ